MLNSGVLKKVSLHEKSYSNFQRKEIAQIVTQLQRERLRERDRNSMVNSEILVKASYPV